MPRQNGKNALIELREIFGLVYLGEKILHTAHRVLTAQAHLERIRQFFGERPNDPRAKYPELNKLVKRWRNGKGEERLELTNGAVLAIASRAGQGPRGETWDVIVIDEAQQTADAALAALLPVVSAASNPQVIYTGTPPPPGAQGAVFSRQRAASLGESPGRRTWHEWSVDGRLGIDFDVHDQALWAATNPAHPHRISLDAVLDELAAASAAVFARERLGWWGVEPGQDAGDVDLVDADTWERATGTHPAPGTVPNALAVDMSRDGLLAVAACVLLEGGRSHVEILTADYTADPAEIVDWIAARAGRRIPVVIDSLSQAGKLIAPLKARGVRVVQASAVHVARATATFVDDLEAGLLTHGGQDALTDAVTGAYRRPIKRVDGFAVGRLDPDVDIAPAVAAVLARYGADAAPRPTGRGRKPSPTRRGVLL